MKRSTVGWALGGLATAGAGALLLERRLRRWGATDEEVAGPMPGDDLIEGPDFVASWAITVQARPEEIWPWLAQLGQGRGGMYSYTWIERLLGAPMENAERVLPEFQGLKAGDAIPLGGGLDCPVRVAEPNRVLVMGGELDPQFAATWAFAIHPENAERSRLISRARVRWPGLSPLLRPFFHTGFSLMSRKMLLGIRRRAESLARQRAAPVGRAELAAPPGGPRPAPRSG